MHVYVPHLIACLGVTEQLAVCLIFLTRLSRLSGTVTFFETS